MVGEGGEDLLNDTALSAMNAASQENDPAAEEGHENDLHEDTMNDKYESMTEMN